MDTLQKKHDRLIDAVRRMRGYQKEYFKYRASSDLKKARHWERHVDALVAAEVKYNQSKQKNIFS